MYAQASWPPFAVVSTNAGLEWQLRDQMTRLRVNRSLALDVESSRVVTPALGQRIDLVSKRSSLAIAAALGLVVGVLLTGLSIVVRPVR